MNRRVITQEAQERLAKLRTLLEQPGKEPVDKEQRAAPTVPDLMKGEEQMLSIVISEALNGVHIPSRYPAFFRKLQTDAKLRAVFLEALDLLEKSYQDELKPLPAPPSRDLNFLLSAPPGRSVEQAASGMWRITWTQAAAQLQNILFPPRLAAGIAYRAEFDYFEAVPLTLFQSEIELEGLTITALLEATQPLAEPDVLRLSLRVALSGEVDEGATLPTLRAHVIWGDYSAGSPKLTFAIQNTQACAGPQTPVNIPRSARGTAS